ncbi:MAG: His/Gly/Thr/Pro-type tRNA ligase C-terminal domain-containing protein [Thermoanaerobaculia bacterium]
MKQVPYMLVIGDSEVADGTVSLRRRDGHRSDGLQLDEFIADVSQRIKQRAAGL